MNKYADTLMSAAVALPLVLRMPRHTLTTHAVRFKNACATSPLRLRACRAMLNEV